MVIYVPVKFKFDWTKRFWVRVQKRKCWQANGQTNRKNYINFKRESSCDGDLSPCQVWIWLEEPFDGITPILNGTLLWWWSMSLSSMNSIKQIVWVRVRKQKCGRTDGWTNGQINTRNYTNFRRNLSTMVIYFPVKFEFDWTNHFQVRVWKQKCGQTDGWTNGQKTDKRTDGITPISQGTFLWWWSMSLSSLNLIGQTVFELESGNENVDRRMDSQTDEKCTTNGWKFTNFGKNLAMMVIYIPAKFEFDWTNWFWVSVRKRKIWTDMSTDRQTDDGHINLTGRLFTRSPPKN